MYDKIGMCMQTVYMSGIFKDVWEDTSKKSPINQEKNPKIQDKDNKPTN